MVELELVRDGGKLFFDKHNITFRYRRFAHSLSSREKLKGGVRFNEEREAYEYFAQQFSIIKWRRAARAAHLHITSRIHSLIS
jgi:hypothetical protein